MLKQFCFVGLLALLAACYSSPRENSEELPVIEVVSAAIFADTQIVVEHAYQNEIIETWIQFPAAPSKGTLLLLQGWNFPNTDWCDSTSICEKALAHGFVVVCPDMGKSIYSDSTYAETRTDWLKYPTRSWLRDDLIPSLAETYIIFQGDQINAIVGLSTGARGALLVAQDLPSIFQSVACLSGDYDQRPFPNDNLYCGFFGSQSQFPERWSGRENPMSRLNQLQSRLFIGHGTADEVVPVVHSRNLVEALSKYENVKYVEVGGARHNYDYWNSQVDAMLEFIDQR